jgi:hypothetical protein
VSLSTLSEYQGDQIDMTCKRCDRRGIYERKDLVKKFGPRSLSPKSGGGWQSVAIVMEQTFAKQSFPAWRKQVSPSRWPDLSDESSTENPAASIHINHYCSISGCKRWGGLCLAKDWGEPQGSAPHIIYIGPSKPDTSLSKLPTGTDRPIRH